ELRGFHPDEFEVKFGRESVEQALALNAVAQSNDGGIWGTLILGQEVANQLACDYIDAQLRAWKKRARQEAEWAANRNDQGGGGGPDEAAVRPEDLTQRRRDERAEREERKRDATAFNLELGAAVFSKLSRLKVDDRVLKLLAAVDFHGNLVDL